MARQRPLAGQRSRTRLGAPSMATPPAAPRPVAAGPVLLDRRPVPAGPPAPVAGDTPRRPDWLLLAAGVLTLALVLTAGLVAMRARGEGRTEAVSPPPKERTPELKADASQD